MAYIRYIRLIGAISDADIGATVSAVITVCTMLGVGTLTVIDAMMEVSAAIGAVTAVHANVIAAGGGMTWRLVFVPFALSVP